MTNQYEPNELSLEEEKEVSSSKGIFDLAKEDKNGFVDMKEVYDSHPEIKKTFVDKIRKKQEMVIDSINDQDLISASLRDKATSAKALGEQVMDIEQGRPIGQNVQVFYIKAK